MRFKWRELRIAALISTAAVALAAPTAQAGFPGANGKLAYSAFTASGDSLIFTSAADGSAQSALTVPGSGFTTDEWPRWSADGQRIVYIRRTAGTSSPLVMQVRVINANGSGDTLVIATDTPGTSFRNFATPAFSPDGTKIVFSAIPRTGIGAQPDIWSVNVNGSNLVNLTNSPATEGSPALSPDGTALAFFRLGTSQFVVANTDGTNQTVVASGIRPETRIDWSPGSSRLVFDGRDLITEESGIWTVARTGGPLTRILTGPGDEEGHEDYYPAWAPDGGTVVHDMLDGIVRNDFVNSTPPNMLVPYGSGTDPVYAGHQPDEQPIVRGDRFECRASGIRVLIIELPIANPPAAPCVAQSHALLTANVGLGLLLSSLKVGVMEVNTHTVPERSADADATTANVNLNLGLLGLGLKAQLVHSEVHTECALGNASSNASTQLVGVILNGNPINVNGPVSIPIPLIGTLHLGWQGYIAGRLTARGIWLDTPLVPGGVVVSESFTSVYQGPCPV